jgi:hypothetical protein
MDNVSVQNVDGIEEAIEARGAILFYLPAYSPDLTPIEQLPLVLAPGLNVPHTSPIQDMVNQIGKRSKDHALVARELGQRAAHGHDLSQADDNKSPLMQTSRPPRPLRFSECGSCRPLDRCRIMAAGGAARNRGSDW